MLVAPRYDADMRSIGELADAAVLNEIMDRLFADGHRRFLHLAGDPAHSSARERRRVFLAAAERLGAESRDVVGCDWNPAPALEAIAGLPAGGATAVVAATDVLAAAAIRGATQRGWRVPHDLSVTGWDDNPVAAVMLPSLASVHHDHVMLGRHAAASLPAVLRGEPAPLDHGPIATVRWRESTGPAPAHERR